MGTEYPSITALDPFLDDMRVGQARRRQLDMSRRELSRALGQGALPVAARGNLRRLLEEETLMPYRRLAESGTLRARRCPGVIPTCPTNETTAQCLDMLRETYGLPALQLGASGRPPPRPTPSFGDLAALRQQLDQHLGDYMSPGHIQLTAVVALVLDAAPRSGELVALRLSDLRPGAVYVDRRPPARRRRAGRRLVRAVDAQHPRRSPGGRHCASNSSNAPTAAGSCG